MQILRTLIIILGVTGIAATASATAVKLQNNTGHKLCVAQAIPLATSVGLSTAMEGWDCFETGQAYDLSEFDDVTYVTVRDANGNDSLVTQMSNFPATVGYAPTQIVDDFRLEIVTLTTGTFSYAYYYGDVDGGNYRIIGDIQDLDFVLKARGFKVVTART